MTMSMRFRLVEMYVDMYHSGDPQMKHSLRKEMEQPNRFIIPNEVEDYLEKKTMTSSIARKTSTLSLNKEEVKYIEKELKTTPRDLINSMKAMLQNNAEEDLKDKSDDGDKEKNETKTVKFDV